MTPAATRQLIIFFIWLVPGAFISWLFKDSVPWVTAMSWYAIVISHWTAFLAMRAKDEASSDTGDDT